MFPTIDRVKALQDAKKPLTASEVKSILGSVTYFAHFIPNLAQAAEPLHELDRS